MKKPLTIAVAFGLCTGAMTALAAEKSIVQKNRQFSEQEVTVKKGDTVVFVNGDTIAHNIFSQSAGNEFNLGAQTPGVSTPVIFKSAGEVAVLCAIHPLMQMTVKVTE